MKRLIWSVVAIAAAIAFILIPIKPADLLLRFDMKGSEVESTYLYYSTTETDYFNEEMCLRIQKTSKEGVWEFRIPGSVARNIKNFRLDFAGINKSYLISGISASSGGLTVKYFNPCVFFAPGNAVFYNDLTFDSYDSSQVIAVYADKADPYFIFSDELGTSLRKCTSDYRLTRFFMVLFVAGAYLIYRKNPFKS